MTKSELIKNALLIASHTQNNPEYEELLKQFDDFVLVPREPTEEILMSIYDNHGNYVGDGVAYDFYKAMIKEGEIK